MKNLCLEPEKVNEASVKSIKFAEALAKKTGSKLPSTSQMMKYAAAETISEAIEEMKAGNQIELS